MANEDVQLVVKRMVEGAEPTNIRVSGGMHVGALKEKIEEQLGISPHRQTLVHRKKKLDDEKTLEEHNVQDGAALILIEKEDGEWISVSGAPENDINGKYKKLDEAYDGLPWYTKDGKPVEPFQIWHNSGEWRIGTSGHHLYYAPCPGESPEQVHAWLPREAGCEEVDNLAVEKEDDWMVVSGSLTAEFVNGRYKKLDEEYDGRPWYSKEGVAAEESFQVWHNGGEWRIGTSGRHSYYAASNEPSPVTVETWHPRLGQDGDAKIVVESV